MQHERGGEGGGSGWGSNAEAEMVCAVSYDISFLGKASKICEVVTKSLQSRYKVITKFCANYYRTRSKRKPTFQHDIYRTYLST